MKAFIKKYWIEVLVFGTILGIYLLLLSPNMTWIDTNSDGIHLTFAARWLYAAHKGSSPIYLLLGHFVQMIQLGTDFWRMGLISVFGSFMSAIFVYKIIKIHLQDNGRKRFYAILGTLIFAGSALVISQTEIVKYYSLTTMFCLIAYWFSLNKHWSLTSLFIGAGLATHPIALFVAIPIVIFNKEIRTWKSFGIVCGMGLFYLYAPLVGKFNPTPMNMWGNDTIGAQIKDVLSTAGMLTGTLYIGDFPKRLLDTIGILGVSLGLAAIPIIIYFVRIKKWWKNELFWLLSIPIIYFICDLAPQTYVYMYPAIAFGAIIAVIALSKMRIRWSYAVASVALVLLVFNANYFDIGRTLDSNLSATEYYNVELAKVPDGQILMPYYGWEWAAIFSYNKKYDRNIIPVCMDTLNSETYQQTLTHYGIKFNDNMDKDILLRQNYIALSIVNLNDNVWTTETTDASTYGCKVVPAKGNDDLIAKISLELPAGRWHWKPSAPYDFITGKIEISDWKFITMSNHNMLMIGLFIWVVSLLFKLAEKDLKSRKLSEKPKLHN